MMMLCLRKILIAEPVKLQSPLAQSTAEFATTVWRNLIITVFGSINVSVCIITATLCALSFCMRLFVLMVPGLAIKSSCR